VGVLAVYQYAVHSGYAENLTRAMAFTTLISANIFLTLVNRSFYYSFITTISYRNSMMPLIIGINITITAMLLYVAPLAAFFKFAPLTLVQLGICAGAGFIASTWFEVLKWSKRLAAK
jgi:Ca2+-transporting ATPase